MFMKLTFARTGFFLFLLAFSFLLLPQTTHAAVNESEYIVENLSTNDIPGDDGSGLVISWKPLPQERRIIEYRIYRGITLDSLFFIGKIDVNVKTGVLGDVMYYYDTDYNYFLDTQAKGKLKREKGQKKDGSLFRRYPRDVSIVGPQLEHYSILGVIPEKGYYYHNEKIEVVTETDTTVYAGLKLHEFSGMYKKLIDDHEYYYSVVAVSESRYYYPHAEAAIGVPRENAPERTDRFYTVFVEDVSRLQFEWKLAIFADDHSDHNVYMLHKKDLNKFNKYVDEQIRKEMNDIAVKEDSTLAVYTPKSENPAKLIFARYCGYPYTPSKTASVNIAEGKIVNEDRDIDVKIDVENIEDYLFVFSFTDRAGYETFSDVVSANSTTTDQLPAVPPFMIIDRENDKGDYNRVMWGKPVVYLTNSTYLNEKKTHLQVNYDFKTNKNYKVRNIFFKVIDEEGKEIAYVNEYYQDYKIKIKLPENGNEMNTLFFEMTFKCNNDVGEDYVLTQTLQYNEQTQSLAPGDLYLGDENVNEWEYYIYKRNYIDEEFRLSKKVAGTQREIFDNIRYKNVHFKIVKHFDEEKNLFLVRPAFSVRMDDEKKATISSNLYPEEFEKTILRNEDELAKSIASKDTLETEDEIKNADDAIEYYSKQIELMKNHPIQKVAASFNNPKERIKFLDKSRHYAKNSFEYKIVKSNGKGIFTETNIYIREGAEPVSNENIYLTSYTGNGIDHFFPRSNWFNLDMIPAVIAALLFGSLVFLLIKKAKKGHDLFIRPIAGIQEIDNAIGRATEMGKPILFVPGTSGIGDVATLAGLAILGKVAKKAAEYDTKILVPVRDYLVLPVAQEIVKEAHYEAGRPDTYDKGSVFFITTTQFAFVAGVNGIMVREKTATNFYMGMFWAEALLMTETGSSTGAIQISGTDAVTQIPFFITTCDYTLIGEELYAASAYMAREPLQLGTLKAVDYLKVIILFLIITGTILSTTHLTFLINAFPEK
jgi:hypothetical protein